ncbi:Cytochrome c oxidase assembly protein PET191 domain containing protein [Russula decolorans]
MSNYCGPLLAALKDCVLHSDCVMKDGKLPSECIKHHLDELPEECKSLRLATFECKRGMLDMRKRFRGNSASAAAARIKQENAPTSTPSTELPATK